jgi:hypothetical protein
MRPECEQFKGRYKDLCEGRGLDGRFTPPQHAVDQFRSSKGLDMIVVTEGNTPRLSPHRQQRPKLSNIGDRLAQMFATEWGALPCGDCKKAIQKLNRMTIEQVRTTRQQVIADIASRASKAVPQYWAKILTSADQFLHLGGTEFVIGRYIDRACQEEEDAQTR